MGGAPPPQAEAPSSTSAPVAVPALLVAGWKISTVTRWLHSLQPREDSYLPLGGCDSSCLLAGQWLL